MTGRLSGKVAIVTGAGSIGPGWGNGKAAAVLFAREGAKVFCLDINLDAVEETTGIIQEEGNKALAHQCDVTDGSQVYHMVDTCVKAFGGIDVLHNNVGILGMGGPVEHDEVEWDKVVATNLRSMFLTCKHVIPEMEKRGKGSIVNISSISGIRWLGVPYLSYATTKGAVVNLTRAIAAQYAPKHIRCNAILPGLMNTPMVTHGLTNAYTNGSVEKMIKIRDSQSPMGHMGDAWDVAEAAVFLASDNAKYITGIDLIVDGGLSLTSVSPVDF